MSKSRTISLTMVGLYIVSIIVLYCRGTPESQRLITKGTLPFLLWIVLSLACIWHSDNIGPIFGRGRLPELAPNWGIFVWLVGWLLLLLPAVVFLYQKIK